MMIIMIICSMGCPSCGKPPNVLDTKNVSRGKRTLKADMQCFTANFFISAFPIYYLLCKKIRSSLAKEALHQILQ